MGGDAPFGPWRPEIGVAERVARFRAMRALVLLLLGPKHVLLRELRAAEDDAEMGQRALATLEALPALTRRRLLAAYATL